MVQCTVYTNQKYIRIETQQNVIHTKSVHEGEKKHALCIRCSEKEEKIVTAAVCDL